MSGPRRRKDQANDPAAAGKAAPLLPDKAEETVQLIAETAEISKNRIVTGQVDVHTVTDTTYELIKATVGSQTVEVTRVPIDRQVEVPPQVRTEGDVTVIPVLEEIIVVEKRLMLKEEIRVRRITRSEEVETTVPLRRQRAVVERHEADETPADRADPSIKEANE